MIGIPDWLDTLHDSPILDYLEPRRVLVFAFLKGWLEVGLQAAVMMAHRNCEVVFAYLPQSAHVFDRPQTSKERRRFHRIYGRALQTAESKRIRFVDLTTVEPTALPPSFERILDRYLPYDTAYCLKRGTPQMDDVERALRAYRGLVDRQCAERLLTLCREERLDSMTIPNGDVLEFGVASRLAEHIDLPYVCWEYADRNHTIWISRNSPSNEFGTARAWLLDEPHILDECRRRRISSLIASRESTDWSQFWMSLQSKATRSPAALRKQLRLDPDKTTLLLCPNLAWDTLVYQRSVGIFANMTEWLRETCLYLADRPDCQVVIREHPAAAKCGDEESPTRILQAALSPLPDHFRLIRSSDPINTYGLMGIADLGNVYVSTSGLEMAQRGLPVLMGGPAHYSSKGFTIDPQDRDEYFEVLRKATAGDGPGQLEERQRDLAWCYSDLWFFDYPKESPSSPNTIVADMKAWPAKRLLSEEGQRTFGRTFDALAGRSID